MFLILIIGFNFVVAYFISFWSFTVAVGWFFFAIGFQFGKWHGWNERDREQNIKELEEELAEDFAEDVERIYN